MLYEDFSKEILKWQGIFDGYPENDDNYRLYFKLILEKVDNIETLIFCLTEHHKLKNKLFPKPFEINDYADKYKKVLLERLDKSPFYKEISDLKHLLNLQKEHLKNLKLGINNFISKSEIYDFEKIIDENEKKLSELEIKRKIELGSKRIG